MTRLAGARPALAAFGLACLASGLGLAYLLLFVPLGAIPTDPIPVHRGTTVTLPPPSGMAAELTLFASLPNDLATSWPEPSELDCVFTDVTGPGGRAGAAAQLFVGSGIVVQVDPVQLDGALLRPVLAIQRIHASVSMRCDGAAIDRLAPVYLLGAGDSQALPRLLLAAAGLGLLVVAGATLRIAVRGIARGPAAS